MPRCRDSATFSAACRHTEQERNSASPSFHSLVWRSKVRGVDAIRKFATAAPDGVKRSSGSSTRLPTTVMTVSPAMKGSLSVGSDQSRPTTSAHRCASHRHTEVELHRTWSRCSVSVGTDDLRAEDRLVEGELAVELLDRGRLGVERDDGVDALGVLLDLVGEATAAPHLDGLDGAVIFADDVEVLVERRLDAALFKAGVEDDHDFVCTQSGLHLLWTRRPRSLRGRRALRSPTG